VAAFKQSLADFNVPLSTYDMDRLVKFLDSSNEGSIEVESLLTIMRGPLSEARSAEVLEMFNRLLAKAKADKGALTLEHIRALYDPKSDYDCVEEKVRAEIPAHTLADAFMLMRHLGIPEEHLKERMPPDQPY
jgi:Ca2+-binding EF-hand superfamily protein